MLYEYSPSTYVANRRADPRIMRRVERAVAAADSVLNVGSGAGSYEPSDGMVVACDPSEALISRHHCGVPRLRAVAERLPFRDKSFDVALAIMTLHHWNDPVGGLRELERVSRRQVLVLFDLALSDRFWLTAEYFNEISELTADAPGVEFVADILKVQHVETIPIPSDCVDGFLVAYWKRPWRYLDEDVRASNSSLGRLPAAAVAEPRRRLAEDIRSGRWHELHRELAGLQEKDYGLRLIIAGSAPAAKREVP